MNIFEELKITFDHGNYIGLVSDDGDDNTEYCGIVIGLSAEFVALLSVENWHSDGVQIFPLKRVKRLERSEVKDVQGEILAWKGVRNCGQYTWIDLSTYGRIFEAIRSKRLPVFVSSNDIAEV